MTPPDPRPGIGCFVLLLLVLLPLLIVPVWPYSATWGWWPLLIVLLLVALFSWPRWPHARGYPYGYYPSAGLGLLAVILLVLLLVGLL